MFMWGKLFVRKLMGKLMLLFWKKVVCVFHWLWSYEVYAKIIHVALTHLLEFGNVRLCDNKDNHGECKDSMSMREL